MQYRIVQEPHFVRAVLSGRLTYHHADTVRALIDGLKGQPGRHVLLDLTQVDFLDSAGIGMLLVLNGELLSAGTRTAMLPGRGQVGRVASLTRIGMIIPTYPTAEAYARDSIPEEALGGGQPYADGEHPVALAVRALISAA